MPSPLIPDEVRIAILERDLCKIKIAARALLTAITYYKQAIDRISIENVHANSAVHRHLGSSHPFTDEEINEIRALLK